MAAFKLPKAQCNRCSSKGDTLLTCSGCKAIRYCSKEHQTADWSEHKSRCTAVKSSRNRMEKEEVKLRNHPGDFMMPANPFNQPAECAP
ncbi:Putative Zinc finger, MYND-type [Septoria linicola]|uniref:Zinc finger, MYND-type n=1 Tax=Septoria linicola TaxID=215465 RepID=A0A9Q9ANB1_9PEZI|nr:Putative Zinc finger, MYND-type [Septoria linicola]